MNNNHTEKKRSPVKRFAAVIGVSALVGFITGIGSEMLKDSGWTFDESIPKAAAGFLPFICFGLLILAVIFSLYDYMQAEKIYKSWDEEDEDTIDRAEAHISRSIIIVSIYLVIGCCLTGVWAVCQKKWSIPEPPEHFLGILYLVLTCAACIVIQRKDVELEKKINPEKKGDTLDSRFQKDWYDSCDEAEKIYIGKCAYKSYLTTTYALVFAWIISLVSIDLFDTGILPVILVCGIWLVQTASYSIEAYRIEHRKHE